VDLRPRTFVLDPALAAASVETLTDAGRALGGMRLYPLGVEVPDLAVLAITGRGQVVALDPTGEWLLGDTFAEALDLLVAGRRPRPLGPDAGWPPPWLPDPDDHPGNYPPLLGGLKRPLGAAFFLPRTPANPYYVRLPDTLAALGLFDAARATGFGDLRIADWGGLYCEVHVLDLDWDTVLVLAFSQRCLLDQIYDGDPRDDADLPVVRAFREACAALEPDLDAAFLHGTLTHNLLRAIAEREYDVMTFDGYALAHEGNDLLYLSDALADGVVPHPDHGYQEQQLSRGRLFVKLERGSPASGGSGSRLR
jgi:hypothetical protein